MHSILKKVIWACLVSIPFIALYVASGHSLDIINAGTSGFYFPFISGKNILFRFLVEIAFFSWVILALRDSAYRINIRKSPLLIAYAVFMVVLLFADLLGTNPLRSFWSNFERMEGFVGHVHLFAYFIVLSGVLHTLKEYGTLFKAFIVSNILVLGFGFAQLFGAYAIHMSENRLDATIGNSAYFAIYCLMLACILALRWSQDNFSFKQWLYPLLIVLNLVALFYTGTRGTQIGFLVAAFITLGLIGLSEKGKIRNAVAGILLVGALLVGSIFVFKDSSFIQSSPSLARFASISPSDLTGMSRLSIWKISFDAWKERPLLGYGQENFSSIFASKFIPEKMWNLEPWYDRSHNVFFDWLVAAGVLGLISYLSLYMVALWLIWRRGNDIPLREKAILTGALVGYFVHNIFVFDNLTSYIIFFFLLAYVAMRAHARGGVEGGTGVSEDSIKVLWLPIVGIAFAASFYFFVYNPIRVNHLLVKGLDINRLVETMTFAQAVEVQKDSFTKAIAINSTGSEEAREQFLQTTIRMSQVAIPEDVPAEDKQRTVQALNNLIGAARADIENSYEAHKDDVRMLSIYGSFYNGIGDSVSAERVLARAHELAPNKQLVNFDLIRAYLVQGKMEEAYILAKQTYDSAPQYDLSVKVYLISAAYAKKWNEAVSLIQSQGKVVPFDVDALSVLVSTKQTSIAVAYLVEAKKKDPANAGDYDAYIKQLLGK